MKDTVKFKDYLKKQLEDPEFYKEFEKWESKGVMTHKSAQGLDKNIDPVMEYRLGEIEELIKENKPNSAFRVISHLTSFINAGVKRQPSIIYKLEDWIDRLKSTANSLAEGMGANGFSISVGLPAGVSIGLSFPITKKQRRLI